MKRTGRGFEQVRDFRSVDQAARRAFRGAPQLKWSKP
jgi:uncharacterized protein (DUF2461 family)